MHQLFKTRLLLKSNFIVLLKLNFILLLLGNGLLLQAAPHVADSTGSISGRVADKDGVALPGASIHLKGTTITVSSSQTGTYSILNLTPGSYTVVTSYMGFETSETTIKLGPSQQYNHNITLQLGKTGLQSVLVTASREGQAKALNQQRMADNIKQVISADLMGRFPDLNVAEALQRLPGVTISRNKGEGATIQLRGTPGGFTNINVNGEQVMGTQENGERNASLDGVSLDVLNSMEVTKTLTPDMDGDAIAGAVNMKTPVAGAGKKNLKVELAGNYNGMSEKAGHVANLSYGTRLAQERWQSEWQTGFIGNGLNLWHKERIRCAQCRSMATQGFRRWKWKNILSHGYTYGQIQWRTQKAGTCRYGGLYVQSFCLHRRQRYVQPTGRYHRALPQAHAHANQ